MNARSDAQHPQDGSGMSGQSINNSFRKSGQIVWRVVINKDQFVIGTAQHLGETVQADCRSFVQIVSVIVVPTVYNDRNHPLVSLARSRRSASRVWADASQFQRT